MRHALGLLEALCERKHNLQGQNCVTTTTQVTVCAEIIVAL